MMHLFMPAVYAVAELRDREFWSVLFAQARRHVLVALPPANSPSFFAPSYVFAAFSRVHGVDEAALTSALASLPTDSHRERAREQVARNPSPQLDA